MRGDDLVDDRLPDDGDLGVGQRPVICLEPESERQTPTVRAERFLPEHVEQLQIAQQR